MAFFFFFFDKIELINMILGCDIVIGFLKNKKNYKFIIGALLGIIVPIIGAYAVSYIGSGSDLTYDNSNSGLESTNVQDALDELYKYKDCPKGYSCEKLKLGDYVSMTPIKSSYTTDTSKTGYSSTQTINPQELNLWRIINFNSDGSIDMISEYVSSIAIYFNGLTGYYNYIGYLNVLASQYENSTYTNGSRYFGFNNQTEYITDKTKINPPCLPWSCSTSDGCTVESQGGGDTLYQKDYDLVNNALKTLEASTVTSSNSVSYWISSRVYIVTNGATVVWRAGGRIISKDGINADILMQEVNANFGSGSRSNYLRPIVTLKAGLKYTGSGTKDDPLKLSVS